MTTPDILETVGFERSKIGSGDKELGYVIQRSRLRGLICGSAVIFALLGVAVVMTLFEVRFERRSFHRQLRKEEHHAASKLAQVEMELWAQYRDDIQESHEAHSLLKSLSASYDLLQPKLQSMIEEASKELNLNTDKAHALADKILHLVADMQKDNLKHAKHLVDHLVKAGKRGATLEKHMEREILHEVKEEERHIEEDGREGYGHEGYGAEGSAPEGGNATEDDPLHATLEGFWYIFNDYEKEFSGKPREVLKEGNAIFKQLTDLHAKIQSPDPPPEEEIITTLDAMDLASVGAGLGSGRTLPASDIVEELAMIPKIPFKELAALEKAWRKGEKDSITVFAELSEWHSKAVVPSGWLQVGVDKEEEEEQRNEEMEEQKEAAEEKAAT
mmetsp:Transcript_21251/g.61352  ORF Transcript_21251/g.61352 Transcript_21251/m.61352 type:complete len:388 (-) Transcript_21251:103-1266(-)